MNVPIPYTEYLAEVKSRICKLCADASDEGLCAISGSGACMVERHLPKIIQVAYIVESTELRDYVASFREHVCVECQKDGAVHCSSRDEGLCGMDKYFPLVVEAVDAVNRRHAI